ncbi:spindle pole body interacting protein [Meira miltonrushii]|uniref:Spindle pole body interacting protein n=1 Tax=Meira miltonrushii TaxID=1280837 RepID=A0A316V6Q3_9BASI|nr:spindle pole body interacting protein [Meira miltonrushii]PWN32171.1 spindle pole body interacting protein [Meira miltonrushii]
MHAPSSSLPTASTSTAQTSLARSSTPDRVSSSALPRTESSNSSRSSSPLQHCSFCLSAEFDIDKGSTLSHQYPAPSGHDEHMLAELMLPDGVHARSEDWTVFFLPDHDITGTSVGKSHAAKGSISSNGGQSTKSNKGKDRENLYYVLNLVRTKHDNTVRRGALVKAIAIVTRHPFIQIFKPALLLALDEYFRQPGVEVLAKLFDALNSLNLSKMPSLSYNEKRILRASDRRDLFEDRFASSSRSVASLRPLNSTPGRSATPLNAMHGSAYADENERGRAESYDTAPVARLRSRSGSGSSTHSNEDTLMKKHQSQSALQQVLSTSRSPSASMGQEGHGGLGVNTISKAHMLSKVKDTHVWETSVAYGKIQELPIRVPTDVFDEEVGEYSLIHLINTFGSSHPSGPLHGHLHSNGHSTHPIILLFNAVVTGKRVIFLGHNLPANQVAGHVLSLCALASGCGAGWRGIVSRCFPYANLGMIDELEQVPGYIAGVTNPRFEDLRAWDVLCNVENGKITIHKSIEPAPPIRPTAQPSETFTSASFSSGIGPDGEIRLTMAPSEPDVPPGSGSGQHHEKTKGGGRERSGTSAAFESRQDAPDNIFMDEVVLAISARYGERYVRSRFIEYAANFVRSTARHEEYYYGSTTLAPPCQPFLNGQLGSGALYADRETELKDIQVNASRIEGWRNTNAYSQLLADVIAQSHFGSLVTFDLGHQIARLRRAKKMNTSEYELVFTSLARNIRTQDQIIELLAALPIHHGGLLPISNGLFHPSRLVQASAHELLIRIATNSVGRKMMQSLNLFHRLAFARYLSDNHDASANGATSYFKPANSAVEKGPFFAGARAGTPSSLTFEGQSPTSQKIPTPNSTLRFNGNSVLNSTHGNDGYGDTQHSTDVRSRHAPSSSIGMHNVSQIDTNSSD